MVRLHALKGMDEHSPAREVVRLLLGGDSTLNGTPGPEGMAHGTPWVLGVRAKVRRAVLADHETRGGALERQVHQTIVVHSGLDGISIAILVELYSEVVGTKGEHAFIEHEVGQGIRVPVVGTIAFEVEDLRCELSGGVETSVGARAALEHEKKVRRC